MNNTIFENNIAALKNRYPKWKINKENNWNKSIDENIDEDIHIEQEKSYDEKEITSVCVGEKKYYLAGKYNPERLAAYEAHIMGEKNVRLQMILGMGDGRVLREYLRIKEEDTYCIVYEPSLALFMHMIQYYDIQDLVEDETCIWIIDKLNSDDFPGIMQLIMTLENAINLDIYIGNNYSRLFPKKIEDIIKKIRYGFDTMLYNWGTEIYFQDVMAQNVLYNLRHIYKHRNVGQLVEWLPNDVPAIIVAAGPSLDKNIEELRMAQGKACIIACDTALKPLLARGIMPDFFVVVDPRKPIELFENDKVWEIPMVSDVNVPYQILDRHCGIKFVFDNNDMIWDILKQISNSENLHLSALSSGGSVANSAFSLAKLMGAKRIVLVGQDLANTGGKLHVSGAFNQEQIDKSEDGIWVEGIDGDSVKTTQTLKHYLEWFEKQIGNDIEVIDATEGGALIHGSKVMKLKTVIELYCQEEVDLSSKMKALPFHLSEQNRKELRMVYQSMPKELEKLKIDAKKAKAYYEKLEKRVSDNDKSNKEATNLVKKISRINKKLEEHYLWKIIEIANKNEEFAILVHTNNEVMNKETSVETDIAMAKDYIEKILQNIKEIEPIVEEVAEFYS